MSEAEACTGEFAHWSEGRRDERLALFFSLIEKYASIGVTCAVPHDIYQKVFLGKVAKEHRFIEHPYFILFYGIVHSIGHHFRLEGRKEPIDFIFDTQTDQMKRIIQTWDDMQKFSHPDIQPLVTNPPIFRNDKMALPLQAADLHAWWAHRMMTAYFTDQPMRRPPLPGKKEALAVPMLEMLWTEERLKRMRRSLTPYITYSEPLQISGQFQEPWRVSVTPERSS